MPPSCGGRKRAGAPAAAAAPPRAPPLPRPPPPAVRCARRPPAPELALVRSARSALKHGNTERDRQPITVTRPAASPRPPPRPPPRRPPRAPRAAAPSRRARAAPARRAARRRWGWGCRPPGGGARGVGGARRIESWEGGAKQSGTSCPVRKRRGRNLGSARPKSLQKHKQAKALTKTAAHRQDGVARDDAPEPPPRRHQPRGRGGAAGGHRLEHRARAHAQLLGHLV